MEENMEKQKDNKLENLIGILLILPVYVLSFVILNLRGDNRILFPLLMYLPIIIGMVLSYKNYNNKVSKTIGVCILIFLLIALYFFYQTYFVDHSGLDGLGYYFFWFINTAILKIFSCIFYGKIVGWKKALKFFFIYVLSVVCSFALLNNWRNVVYNFWRNKVEKSKIQV